MAIKAIFFDFDLTLVNSMKGAKATHKIYCRLLGQKPSKKTFRKYVGSKFSEVIDELHKKTKIPKKELIKQYEEVYANKIPNMKFYGKKLFPKIKKQKIIILSNNHNKSVKQACNYFNIKYTLLFGNEDMKNNEKKHDIILKILKKLKIKKSEAVYVGDHINDVKEAHKAGVKAVVVPTGVFKRLYLKRYHPDFMLSNLNNLTKIIK